MIPVVNLRQPARIAFGAGCFAECVDELLHLGSQRVLVVSSKSVFAQVTPVLEACAAKGLKTELLQGIPPEPAVSDFEALRARKSAFNPDAVLAVGGGSVLDVSKLLCALPEEAASVRAFFGNGLLPRRKAALICVPTTAGAGSEVSPNAILYDEVDALKKAVISPWLVPDAAFIDPELTRSLPAATTAATGMDALTHCLEAVLNRFSHPAVDLLALEGIRLISSSLEKAVRHGGDLAARTDVARGSLYGGLCLGPVNTAAVHALAYPLGSRFRLAHGLSNALLLPHVFRFNLETAPGPCARAAMALGIPHVRDERDMALAGAERLRALNAACGVPSRLSELGIRSTDLTDMATDAMKITRLLKNNPREVTFQDALQIYQSAF